MDKSEFEEQIDALQNKLFRFASSYMGNYEDAKDIVQETFIKLWDNKSSFLNKSAIPAWCFKVAKNKSLDRLKSHAVSKKSTLESAVNFENPSNPEKEMETKDNNRIIYQLIDSLPEKQRKVFELRDLQGLSYQEISDYLEFSVSDVKITLYRARQEMRKHLIKTELYENY